MTIKMFSRHARATFITFLEELSESQLRRVVPRSFQHLVDFVVGVAPRDAVDVIP